MGHGTAVVLAGGRPSRDPAWQGLEKGSLGEGLGEAPSCEGAGQGPLQPTVGDPASAGGLD